MKAVGIIVEYNPFHNGHKYHAEMAKKITEADLVIAVMSGNYVQRGEPAIFDKWSRSQWALVNGVDLVVELPYYSSLRAAKDFAKSAIKILDRLKIESIVFGSEVDNIEVLYKISEITNSVEFNDKLKWEIKNGESYPNAFSKVMKNYFNDDYLTPNNILGIEYINAIKNMDSNINPYILKREKVGFYHDGVNENIASATYIRKLINEKNYIEIQKVIPVDIDDLKKLKPISIEDYYEMMRVKILTGDIKDTLDMEEGLENRIYDAAFNCRDYNQFFQRVKNRRITESRLKRVLMQILFGMSKMDKDYYDSLNYIRILGFTKTGQQYLSSIKKGIDIPILSSNKNIKKILGKDLVIKLNKEFVADELYGCKSHIINKNYAINL